MLVWRVQYILNIMLDRSAAFIKPQRVVTTLTANAVLHPLFFCLPSYHLLSVTDMLYLRWISHTCPVDLFRSSVTPRKDPSQVMDKRHSRTVRNHDGNDGVLREDCR